MSRWPDEEELVGRLRRWLAETRSEADRATDDGRLGEFSPPLADFDWLEVLAEFTALRHEVKLHTKSVRGLEDETSRALAGLEKAIAEFRAVQAKEAEAAERAAWPLVEAIVELHEAMERGAAAVRAAAKRFEEAREEAARQCAEKLGRLPWWQRWLARWWVRRAVHDATLDIWQAHLKNNVVPVLQALAEGYFLGGLRIQRIMQEGKISRIEAVGRPFDPNQMTAVELADAAEVPPGHVAAEIRPGYRWRDKVVRFTEVRVARESGQAARPAEPAIADE